MRSIDLNSIPEVLRHLMFQINRLMDENSIDRSQTHPPKLRQRANNIVVMWNIFLEQKSSLNNLMAKIDQSIETILSQIRGEVIKFNVDSGTIKDMGTQEFRVIRGKIWNVYFYEPEDFLSVRLVHEETLHDQEQWISVDIDLVTNSAWFVD
ncbi:MAG: hypothetical protein ACFFE8_05365 [Candidatus Heimdallarchaeota archaeon]